MVEKKIEEVIHSLLTTQSEADKSKFYDLTCKKLYNYCLLLTKNVELADDLFHDTYIKAYKNLSGLKNKSLCNAWLKQIAKNVYLDYIKKSSTKNEINIFEDDSIAISTGETILKFDIISTLEKLNDDFREAIYLIDMEGMSYLEAAKVADISEQAMKTRLYRARQNFISEYNLKDGESCDAPTKNQR